MLRTQRIEFFDGISKNPSKTADDLYFECVDFFTEDSGNTSEGIIKKAFRKLREFIQKILGLFKKKGKEKISEADMNDTIPVDEENLKKTNKFLDTIKKIFTWPIEKIASLVKNNKVVGISLAAITGFTVANILSIKVGTNYNVKKMQKNGVKRSILMNSLNETEAILRQAERSAENAEKKLDEAKKERVLGIGTKEQRNNVKKYKAIADNTKKQVKEEQEKRSKLNYALGLLDKDDNNRKKSISNFGGNPDINEKISIFQAYHQFMTKVLNIIKSIIGKLQEAAFFKGASNKIYNAKNKITGSGLRAIGDDVALID